MVYIENEDTETIRFSNYLKMEINDASVMKSVSCMTNAYSPYSQLFNTTVDVVKKLRKVKCLYHGFHRFLFDLIVYGEGSERNIVLSLMCQSVSHQFFLNLAENG